MLGQFSGMHSRHYRYCASNTCSFRWNSRFDSQEKTAAHISHTLRGGLSGSVVDEWIFRCLDKWLEVRNWRPHVSQRKDFSPLCTRICTERLNFKPNALPQTSHAKALMFEWEISCRFSPSLVEKPFLHVAHTNLRCTSCDIMGPPNAGSNRKWYRALAHIYATKMFFTVGSQR